MKLFLRSIAFIALAAFSSIAQGQYTIWSNGAGTTSTFETPSNWNNGLPNTGVIAYVVPDGIGDSTGAFLVTPGGAVNIVINASSNQASSGLAITNDVGATLTDGTVTMTFSSGTTYTITNNVSVRQGEGLIFTGNLSVGGNVLVGTTGNGDMTFTGGTLDASSGTIDVGDGAGNTGTFTQSGGATVLASFLDIGIGGGTGAYTLSGPGTNNFTLSSGGEVFIGNGTFTQNNSASTVDFSAGTTISMGRTAGDVATYNLQAGTLIMTNTFIGDAAGSTAFLNQTGGSLTATGLFNIGESGTGTYTMSAGTADFQSGMTLGDAAGSSGTVVQGGGTLNAEGLVTVGNAGTGSYTLGGGSATFSAGLQIGAGSNFYLYGGTLQVAPGGLTGTGNFNGGGGTLQIIDGGTSGTSFTDPYNGTLTSGVTTIDASQDATVTNVTMAGMLQGGGGIKFIGSSASTAFSFGSNNTYTGATVLQTGTLTATLAQIGSSNLIELDNPASTLDLATATVGVNKLGADLIGDGVLNVSFANPNDTLELANPSASNFAGNINLGTTGTGTNNNAGTLQIFNGTFGAINDPFATGSGVTIGGDSSVANSGSVTFTQNQPYTGLTKVNSGFSLFAPGFAGSVMNSGTLGTLGTIANPQATTIGGNLTSTNKLVINTNGVRADSFTANTANLSGIIQVYGSGTNTYTIVTASGGITIGGNGLVNNAGGLAVSTTSSGPLFGASLAPDPFAPNGTALLLHTGQRNFQQARSLGLIPALTPNEAAAASVLNPIISQPAPPPAFAPVLTTFNGLSAAAIPHALEALTPENLAYARTISFEGTSFLVQRMNNVDSNLRSGYGGLDTNAISVTSAGFNTGLGRSLSSLLASDSPFHQAAPNGVNYYPESGGVSDSGTVSVPEASPTPGWEPSSQVISDSGNNPYMSHLEPSSLNSPAISEFISGDVVLADLNQDLSAANAPSSKASYTAGNVTAGVSYRITSNFTAGVLFDYDHTDAKTDGAGSKTTVDTYSPGLFATYFDHGFYANGLFAFGYNQYSNTRDIQFLNEQAKSKPGGEQYTGDVDFGYDFHPDKHWVVGPTGGLTYSHLDIDPIQETGAPGANLAINGQSADSLRSRLGGHALFQINVGNILLQPNLTAEWQHEYLDDSDGITSSFSDFNSSPFTIRTPNPSRDSALLGIGLNATISNSLTLYLNYMADAGADTYFAQSIIGGFKARF